MKMLNRKSLYAVLALLLMLSQSCGGKQKQEASLKNSFENLFLMGTALDSVQIVGSDTLAREVIEKHFNAIVAENVMKSEVVQPKEGEFDFIMADKLVDYGVEKNLVLTGHTLIWHSQAPRWFFVDKDGKDVSREVLIDRMKNHIHTVVTRYKGKIEGWDVVNEAILDNGDWRQSKFFQIIGEEFIELAFRFAHEADPDAELYYNDYAMDKVGKRKSVVKLVKDLQKKGIRIDGVGMQSHISLEHPEINEYEKSIKAFGATGVKVMITELDMTVLPMPKRNIGADVSARFKLEKKMNPYADGLPDSVSVAMTDRYMEFFNLYIKHSDVISRVTLWGVNDKQSWRNYWPVPGRTDYPLFFDRDYKAKPIVEKLIKRQVIVNK